MSARKHVAAFRAVLGLAVLGLAFGRAPEPQESSTAQLAAVEHEVSAFLARYIDTLESGDDDAIRALFVEDDRFAWYTDGTKSYATPDDVLASMRQYAGIEFHTTLSDVRVVALDKVHASARSAFHTTLTIPGADDYEYGGVITWVTEKDPASGAWQVLLGHTSTPGGPPSNDEQR